MKVLDLFSGLGGWSQAFKDRGHEVITVDIEPRFNPTICADINNLSAKDFDGQKFDVILASPPCNNFSVMAISRHWSKEGEPNSETKESIKLVGHTIDLILNLFPRWWILENPRGMMRRVLGIPHITTYFGSWQDKETIELMKSKSTGDRNFHKNYFVKKPTDLWGAIPKGIKWEKPTEWIKASRGARTGVQGIKRVDLRGEIPYGLSLAVCEACEKELGVGKLTEKGKLVSEKTVGVR